MRNKKKLFLAVLFLFGVILAVRLNVISDISAEEKGSTSSSPVINEKIITTSDSNSTDASPDSVLTRNNLSRVSQDVSSWTEFVAALQGNSDEINIVSNLVATSNPPIARKVTINGNNNKLDMRTYYMNSSDTADVTIRDVEFTGTTGKLMQGTGLLTLSGTIKSTAGNAAQIAVLHGWNVIFDNANLSYDSTSANPAVMSKNLTITNKSVISSDAEKFYGNDNRLNVGGKVLIDSESKVRTHSMKGQTSNTRGQAWDMRQQLDFFVDGKGTELDIKGDGQQQVDYGGILVLVADESTLNLTNGAKMTAYGTQTSAIVLQSKGGSFNVSGSSELSIVTDGDHGYTLGAALRFREAGDMTFNVSGNSKINILKKSGRAPGIRMYGGNNKVNISGGSDFMITNYGDGTPRAPGVSGGNQAIYFTGGVASLPPNSFTVEGADSNIALDAKFGASIDSGSRDINIYAGPETYFVSRGNTNSANNGIFNGREVSMAMDSVKYFDFSNVRTGGGLVFDVTRAASSFSSKNSELSVWKRGMNLESSPIRSFPLVDFELTGTNFGTVSPTSSQDVITGFAQDGGMPAYTRLTANNQAAIIDELRVPTDADKFIWGHAVIPEGKHDEPRDAYVGEVHTRVSVSDDSGEIYQGIAEIIEDSPGSGSVSVYGDDTRSGMFKLAVPNDKFLVKEQKVKVASAWRGPLDKEGTNYVHTSEAKDLTAPERTVLDVTPPTPTKLTDIKLNNATKVLSGTGAEDGATVNVYYDTGDKDTGTLLGTSTVKSDGSWTFNLPNYVEKTKELSVYLADGEKQHQAAQIISEAGTKPEIYDQIGLIKPPVTNTADGNINPYKELTYHDAVFKGVEKYFVADVIPDNLTMTKTAVSSGGDTTSVGDIVTYTLEAANKKADSYSWKNVKLIDILPEGLNFDPDKSKVTIDGVTVGKDKYSYEIATRTLTIFAGDIAANKSVKATFEVTVEQSAVTEEGTEVLNKARALGDSPQEEPFVPGPTNPSASHVQIEKWSLEIGLPGGPPHGVLTFVSAPKSLDFGQKVESLKENTEAVNPTIVGDPLVVADNRGKFKSWTLSAQLLKPLTHVDGKTVLKNAIYYKGKEDGKEVINEITGTTRPIVTHTHTSAGNYDISQEEWSKGDGFRIILPPGAVDKLGKYSATIEFTLAYTK